MKHNRLKTSVLLLFFCPFLAMAQNVTDADFYQEGKTVVVTYTLDKQADVTLKISSDGGKTYSAPLKKVSGNVGKNVPAGRNRIVWNALEEYDKVQGENFVFKIEASSNSHNGHEYVDLGLPSGTLWATCNVGATKPEEYGDYFAWGETKPKSTYKWGTYKYGKYNANARSNYGMKKYNKTDGKTTLDSTDDAATANWGNPWRMPTYEEQKELLNNCTWTWTTRNGVNGYEVKGKNGNSLFLPAAGYRDGSSLYYTGSFNYFWSSSLYSGSPYFAYDLYFGSGGHNWSYGYRCSGRSVRAVLSKP